MLPDSRRGLTDGRVRRDGGEFSSSAVQLLGDHMIARRVFAQKEEKQIVKRRHVQNMALTRPHGVRKLMQLQMQMQNKQQASRRRYRGAQARRGVLRAPLIISCQSLENPKP